tara:strand:+ start:509 stop:985 length:477 start_codon:yes stop_codon:yes gene_type:complete
MPKVFNVTEIAKRGEMDGRNGLMFSKRPTVKPTDQTYLTSDPSFRKGAFATMNQSDRDTFTNEQMARTEFLLEKPNLAGTKEVSAYEDKSEIPFNPLKDLDPKQAGSYSYDSGMHQGGETGATFLRKNNTYYGGRVGTLEIPDSYHANIAPGIKIKMG